MGKSSSGFAETYNLEWRVFEKTHRACVTVRTAPEVFCWSENGIVDCLFEGSNALTVELQEMTMTSPCFSSFVFRIRKKLFLIIK